MPIIRNAGRGRVLAEVWLLAFGAAVVAYIILNGPLLAMARNFAPLAYALAFVASYAGLGFPLARWLLPGEGSAEHLLLGIAFGMGFTGLFVFGLGVVGVVEPWLYAAWTLAGLAVLPLSLPFLRHRRGKLGLGPRDAFTVLAGVVVLLSLLVILPGVTAPPVSTDALEYHLLIPKIFLGEGRIGPIPFLVEASYPSLAEYLYMPVLSLAGGTACKALHLWTGLVAALALARLVRHSDPKANPLLPAALFFAMPLAAYSFALAWNDAFFVLFLLLALYQLVLFHGSERQKVGPLIAAGLALGLAAWTKYTIVMVLAALAAVLLLAVARWGWRWLHVIAVAVPVALVSLFVFVKNWVFTGNPFYPFLSSLFPSATWNAAADAFFHNALRRWEIGDWSWTTYLTFPFRIALAPRLVDVHTGVIPLVMAPLLLLGSATREVRFLKVFVVCGVLAWLLIHTENRSLLVILAVLLAVAQSGLDAELRLRPSMRRAVVLLLAGASLVAVCMTAFNSLFLTSPLGYFVGAQSRRDYLLKEVPSQATYEFLNRDPSVNRVLLVGLHDPYYLDRYPFFSSFSDPPIAETLSRGIGSVRELRDRLLGLGVTHVVVNASEYMRELRQGLYSWPPTQRELFEAFLRRECEPVVKLGPNQVLRIQRGSQS